jgi:hypothetical protein
MEVLERLIVLCQEFARGNYEKVNELSELTIAREHPRVVAELAESFGMMMVKVEAREVRLEQIIEDLEKTKRELEIARKKLAMENVELKKELHKLQVEIDHSQKARDVAEITETDYFKSLQEKARDLKGKAK